MMTGPSSAAPDRRVPRNTATVPARIAVQTTPVVRSERWNRWRAAAAKPTCCPKVEADRAVRAGEQHDHHRQRGEGDDRLQQHRGPARGAGRPHTENDEIESADERQGGDQADDGDGRALQRDASRHGKEVADGRGLDAAAQRQPERRDMGAEQYGEVQAGEQQQHERQPPGEAEPQPHRRLGDRPRRQGIGQHVQHDAPARVPHEMEEAGREGLRCGRGAGHAAIMDETAATGEALRSPPR